MQRLMVVQKKNACMWLRRVAQSTWSLWHSLPSACNSGSPKSITFYIINYDSSQHVRNQMDIENDIFWRKLSFCDFIFDIYGNKNRRKITWKGEAWLRAIKIMYFFNIKFMQKGKTNTGLMHTPVCHRIRGFSILALPWGMICRCKSWYHQQDLVVGFLAKFCRELNVPNQS